MEQSKNADWVHEMLELLDMVGYTVDMKILNSLDFGVPQHRRRAYLVGIRKDVLRAKRCGVDFFPSPVPLARNLMSVVKPLAHEDFEMLPTDHKLHTSNVERCLGEASRKGINPFITPIVIDAGATPKFVQWKEDVSLTLCEKRASAGLYWCSTKGGYITVDEVSALQGFDGTINYRSAGVNDTAYAGCLGAAQTLTVVEHVLPHALFLAQMVTKADMDTMKSACRS
jgi:site-specific DNA-cytosine methylase